MLIQRLVVRFTPIFLTLIILLDTGFHGPNARKRMFGVCCSLLGQQKGNLPLHARGPVQWPKQPAVVYLNLDRLTLVCK